MAAGGGHQEAASSSHLVASSCHPAASQMGGACQAGACRAEDHRVDRRSWRARARRERAAVPEEMWGQIELSKSGLMLLCTLIALGRGVAAPLEPLFGHNFSLRILHNYDDMLKYAFWKHTVVLRSWCENSRKRLLLVQTFDYCNIAILARSSGSSLQLHRNHQLIFGGGRWKTPAPHLGDQLVFLLLVGHNSWDGTSPQRS